MLLRVDGQKTCGAAFSTPSPTRSTHLTSSTHSQPTPHGRLADTPDVPCRTPTSRRRVQRAHVRLATSLGRAHARPAHAGAPASNPLVACGDLITTPVVGGVGGVRRARAGRPRGFRRSPLTHLNPARKECWLAIGQRAGSACGVDQCKNPCALTSVTTFLRNTFSRSSSHTHPCTHLNLRHGSYQADRRPGAPAVHGHDSEGHLRAQGECAGAMRLAPE